MKHSLFRLLAISLVFVLLLPMLLACGDTDPTPASTNLPPLPNAFQRSTAVTDLVCLAIRDYGNVIVQLIPSEAPQTVQNFKNLVSSGFYSGKTFHRIINGFMIQGGAPAATDTPPSNIIGEFYANGVENRIGHERGVISMARTDIYNSASSQFFIVQNTENSKHLDGYYAAFGYVLFGMDVVDAIAGVATDSSDAPLSPVIIAEAYFVTMTTAN